MKRKGGVRTALRELFSFTPSQVRGIVFLLPLLGVAGIIIALANRPHFEKSFLELADIEDSTAQRAKLSDGALSDNSVSPSDSLFIFDPNTVTLQELCRLGFTTRTAAGIIKYRENGKRFEIPEDFATCYGVSLEDYSRLEPYINIGELYRSKPAKRNTAGISVGGAKVSTATANISPFDPNTLDRDGFVALGFSSAQADVIIRYRHSIGGFKNMEDIERCYVVSDEMVRRLAPYVLFRTDEDVALPTDTESGDQNKSVTAPDIDRCIEINAADSATLRSVRGIGEVLVVRIMDYRERLGGFACSSQLSEIKGMSRENLELILEQIRVDSCEIQKIDINFAPHKTLVAQMGKHPYATDVMLRKLLKNRQLKGGWSTIGDMIEENIMTGREAEKLSPYLLFRSE